MTAQDAPLKNADNGPAYDFPPFEGTPRVYAICAVPRSGSTLLSKALWQTGLAGAPTEYFNERFIAEFRQRWGDIELPHYVARLLRYRTSPNGVFGMSVMLHHIERHHRHMPTAAKAILTYRRDKIRQAVSWARAAQNDQWTSEMIPTRDAQYSRRLIEDCLRLAIETEARWRHYLSSRKIVPLEIAYEDLRADYPGTVQRVATFIGVPLRPDQIAAPLIRKQADQISEDWALRFVRDCRPEIAGRSATSRGTGSNPCLSTTNTWCRITPAR